MTCKVWRRQDREGEEASFRQSPTAEGSLSLTLWGALEGKSYLTAWPDSRHER